MGVGEVLRTTVSNSASCRGDFFVSSQLAYEMSINASFLS